MSLENSSNVVYDAEQRIKIYKVLVALLVIIALLIISFLLRYLGSEFADYSSDILAIAALTIVIWKEFLVTRIEPRREYNVSPQKLVGRRLDKLKLHVIVQNTGAIPVNLRFTWIDIDNGSRIQFFKLFDSKEIELGSDITIQPGSSKDLFIIFKKIDDDPKWHQIQKDVSEATEKKDIRLLGEAIGLGGRLCWSDATNSAQEVRLPFGAMLKDFTNHKINNPLNGEV